MTSTTVLVPGQSMFVDIVIDELPEVVLEILLSNITISEALPVGGLVGTLSVYGGSGTEVFTITNDPDDMFSISGNQLLVAGSLEFNVSSTHFVAISATGGLSQIFTIGVTQDPARPIDISRTTFVDGSEGVLEYFEEGEVASYLAPHNGLSNRNNLLDSYVETVRPLALKGAITTGTIAAASNSLTVASAAGFSIGDRIVIETGGEAGLGLRGTEGVGGAWPSLSYPDEATMRADTGQAPFTFCWLRDSGRTWQWNWFGPVDWFETNPGDTDPYRYYYSKANPKALVTTVTNIVGNVLTLTDLAVVASTGANVYIDNLAIFNAAIALGGTRVSLTMPAGVFTITDQIAITGASTGAKHGWSLKGAGREVTTLLVPKGVQLSIAAAPAIAVSNLTEFRAEGFHLHMNYGLEGYVVPANTLAYWDIPPYGVNLNACYECEIRNVKTTDCPTAGINCSYGVSVWVYNCKVAKTSPGMRYNGWEMAHADSFGGGNVDCESDLEWYGYGFEYFSCRQTLCQRLTMRNGMLSFNSADGKILNSTITMEEHKKHPEFRENHIVTLNTNIGRPVYFPSLIENLDIVQEGYANQVGPPDYFGMLGIIINSNNFDVTVRGGSFTAPPSMEYSVNSVGPVGVNSDGPSTIVDGFTCTGATFYTGLLYGGGYANVNVQHGSIQNCTLTTIMRPEDVGYPDWVSVPPSSGNTVTIPPPGPGSY